jgi:hypothetical protein
MAAEDLGLLPGLTGPLPPLLVTASRDGLTEADVESALRPHFAPSRTLISGSARGGDRIAEELWERWGGEIDRNPVDPQAWQQSRAAGYHRDAAMVAKGRQLGAECVAIIARCGRPECAGASPHGSHGAVNTARMAAAAGLPVDRVKAGARSQGSPTAEPETKRHGGHYPPEMELPEGICPGCRSATLTSGRKACQASGMAESYSPAPGGYADLSHGHAGHMCVLPDQTGREAEAGS